MEPQEFIQHCRNELRACFEKTYFTVSLQRLNTQKTNE